VVLASPIAWFCHGCPEPILLGEEVIVRRGVGAFHLACAALSDKAARSRPVVSGPVSLVFLPGLASRSK
jgi:hypothetical protein